MRKPMVAGACAAFLCWGSAAPAQTVMGVTESEIKLGSTVALSGPASSFASYGRVMAGYFQKLNEAGGVNGRKINFTLLDNAFSPPKAIEQTRKLVEETEIFAEVGTVGTTPNVATQKYMNDKKVPQLFISAGGRRFNDPKTFPWTIPLYPAFEMEGAVMAKYVLATKPDARIAILYQNDDFGRDFIKGLKGKLGEKAGQIVAEAPHEISDSTVDSQILKLRSTGADVLFAFTTPKFAAQAIRKTAEIGWKPMQILASPASSIDGVLKPAGLDASVGVLTTQFTKQPADPAWANDPEVERFKAFMAKYDPTDNPSDFVAVSSYVITQAIALALERCGKDLTRENLLKQATTFKNVRVDLLLPGVTINNSPSDYSAYKSLRVARFDGKNWVLQGDAISAD